MILPDHALKSVGGTDILYVMAADPEYGAHLRARITPLMTGVGPVEAAIAATRALTTLAAAGRLPGLVVCLGSSGSPTLQQARVYQASSVSWRDMDATALGFEKGRTPFLDLPAEIGIPLRIPGIPEARLSTGADIVSGDAYRTIDADMVDMEAYAVLRACQTFEIPFAALRGISDGRDELGHIDDWTRYLHVVDAHLAEAVDLLENALGKGGLALLRATAR